MGNDSYELDQFVIVGYVYGDSLPDLTQGTGDGGDDTITISGTAVQGVSGDYSTGNGGDDVIVVTSTGETYNILGDDGTANGGNDTITVDGNSGLEVVGDATLGAGGDDTITINGIGGNIIGDGAATGGNDIITINGRVDWVKGDDTTGPGGDDTITIGANAIVSAFVDADDDDGTGGNDTVIIEVGAQIAANIMGGGGFDILEFDVIPQELLDNLDPASGTITYGGQTYTWVNFEQLVGVLRQLTSQILSKRIIYNQDGILAVAENHGVTVMAEPGRIALISYASLESLGVSEVRNYSTPNSAGWYVAVLNLGDHPEYPAKQVFLVTVYSPAGSQAGQFAFSD